MGQSSPKAFGVGEGGKKVRVANAAPEARSQNICPVYLIRVTAAAGLARNIQFPPVVEPRQAGEKTSSQKEE